jgi:hypothetical protein
MESKILELRERGRRQVRRAGQVGLAAAGLAALLVGGFIVYRLTRPPSTGERLRRLVPGRVASFPDGARKRLPSMRLYLGDKQVGEGRKEPSWERLVIRAAAAAGTAAAGALAPRLIAALTGSARRRDSAASDRPEAEKQPTTRRR